MTLNQLPPGKCAVIEQLYVPHILRCRLLDLGMVPGTRVQVRKYAPLGDPLEISLRGYTLVIRMETAEKIKIRPILSDGKVLVRSYEDVSPVHAPHRLFFFF